MTDLPFTIIINPTRCHIKATPSKGRGVFATQAIPPRTVVEASPVLLFTKQEYDDHGRHTLLDHYTFNWRDGRMALALGLGSLFNHSENPNLSFSLDIARERIVYTSVRTIEPDEELCIFYGHQLWFDPVDGPTRSRSDQDQLPADPLDGLADDVFAIPSSNEPKNWDDVVEEDDLPFIWKKLALEKEEEQLDDVELVQAWVVDLPDPRHIATMLRWIKQTGLDKNDALLHLKRVRRQGTLITTLLDTSPDPPALPLEPALERPYVLSVPRYPARTPTSLALKNTFWPTVFCPKRKWEPEQRTNAHVRWATDAVRRLKAAYADAVAYDDGHGELNRFHMPLQLPVVAHIPVPYRDDERQLSRPIFAYDARASTKHPLRHAVLDVIRQVADDRAQRSVMVVTNASAERQQQQQEAVRNGSQYLLTGLSLFITHEPCLMCTMALLHSRVKEVFYLVPMPQTGGCGGIACVPALKGINHRFSIAVWKEDEDPGDWPRALDPVIDV